MIGEKKFNYNDFFSLDQYWLPPPPPPTAVEYIGSRMRIHCLVTGYFSGVYKSREIPGKGWKTNAYPFQSFKKEKFSFYYERDFFFLVKNVSWLVR